MEFNIYSNKKLNFLMVNDENLVESGLSGGEMRQSLLDRFGSNIKDNKDLLKINFTEEEIESIKISTDDLLTAAEELLYFLTDEALVSRTWDFKSEKILVVGV